MTFNQAVKILSGKKKPGAAGYVEYQTAAAVYNVSTNRDFFGDKMNGQIQHRLTTDQAPVDYGEGAADLPEVTRDPRSGIHGALVNETNRIGGTVVARLPRTASSYQLLDSPDGDGCLVLMVGDNDGSIDVGAVTNGESALLRGHATGGLIGDARRYQQNRHHALGMLVRAAGGKAA